MLKILKDWFTERDGESRCPVSLIILAAAGAMTYEFLAKLSTDYQGYALGVAALCAGKAVKYASEK